MAIGTNGRVHRDSSKPEAIAPIEKIMLRHTPSGEVTGFMPVDCREILQPGSEYEPADDEAAATLASAKITGAHHADDL